MLNLLWASGSSEEMIFSAAHRSHKIQTQQSPAMVLWEGLISGDTHFTGPLSSTDWTQTLALRILTLKNTGNYLWYNQTCSKSSSFLVHSEKPKWPVLTPFKRWLEVATSDQLQKQMFLTALGDHEGQLQRPGHVWSV